MVHGEDGGPIRKTETPITRHFNQRGFNIEKCLIGVGRRKKYKRSTEAVQRYQLLTGTVTILRAREWKEAVRFPEPSHPGEKSHTAGTQMAEERH